MKKINKFIVNNSILIIILSLILLIPSYLGYKNTSVNYNVLVYLPEDLDTVKGQNILADDFGIGAFSFVITDNKSTKDILELEKSIKNINGVNNVLSISDVTDTTIPIYMLPEDIINTIYDDNDTVIVVLFDKSTSSNETIEGVKELRSVVKDASKVSSMTSLILDTMELSEKEIVSYIIIAVSLCLIVLLVSTDSYFVPILLLLNIGIAIIYNMGSNIIFKEISYITKAISAVLQLGVTTDFSIFLYHKYEQSKQNNKDKKIAMEEALNKTIKSVLGSSLTTIAGFLALATMQLTLGKDIGFVMAKGVLMGLICVFTLFPSLLLIFDGLIEKTKHKKILPDFKFLQKFSIKYYKYIIIVFLLLLIPAYIGNKNLSIYYNLDESLPENLPSRIANSKLKEKFDIVSPEIILIDKNIKETELLSLTNELNKMDGINLVLAPKSINDFGLPSYMIDDEILKYVENDKYQLIIINSTYDIATKELNNNLNDIKSLVRKYDKDSIVAGEGALTKDLTDITDVDFRNVNIISIVVIFIIMLIVLKSISLPVILVATIEFAIFLNIAISYYFGISEPFVSSIVIGTIQLGATIDYAILMSTKYLDERKINSKEEAIKNTLSNTIPSILISASCFFAATFGVAMFSKIDMISSLCNLLARGSIISMLAVILILPALLMVFDKIIVKTTKGSYKYEK